MDIKDELKVDLNKNRENHEENFVKKYSYKDRKEFIQEEKKRKNEKEDR